MLLTVLLGKSGDEKTTLLKKLKEKKEIDIILGNNILSDFFSELIYHERNIFLYSFEDISEILEILFKIERKKGFNFFTNDYKWGVGLPISCSNYKKIFAKASRINSNSFVLENIIFTQLDFIEYKTNCSSICRVDFKIDINTNMGEMFSYNISRRKALRSIIDKYFEFYQI